MNTVEKKIKGLQALLGDEAAKEVLAEAERREKAAKEAGVEYKEVKTKDGKKDDKPVSLAHVLSQIEEGVEQGWIENDLPEDDDTEAGVEAVEELDLEAMGKEIASYVDTAVKEATKELRSEIAALRSEVKGGFMPRHKERDAQIETLQKELKEGMDRQKEIQAQMAELMGLQPRRVNGYRSTQDDNTVRNKEAQTTPAPAPDPVGDFIGEIFGQNYTPVY